MQVAIVFESMFGNTETLVDAVAAGLQEAGAQVTVHRAGEDDDHDLGRCDLLVLAAPTHTFTLSRPSTRAGAVEQGADPATAVTGVREWLAGLESDPHHESVPEPRPPVAVFDTRARSMRHGPGSAARRTARALRRKGFEVPRVNSFYVEGVQGPLVEGERERARSWGRRAAEVARPGRTHPGGATPR